MAARLSRGGLPNGHGCPAGRVAPRLARPLVSGTGVATSVAPSFHRILGDSRVQGGRHRTLVTWSGSSVKPRLARTTTLHRGGVLRVETRPLRASAGLAQGKAPT
jgi:hypothetical protein